jgi:hypothetical protein
LGAESKARRFSRKQLIGALTVAATVIGLLSSSTSLFDWFGKEVNPVTPPPAVISSHLTRPQLVSADKTLGAFLAEIDKPTTSLTAYELAEEGFEFTVGIHLQGEQGRNTFLMWTVLDDATGIPLAEPIYHQEAARLQPRGPDQSREVPIWIPSPPRRGKFDFQVILLDQNHRPLVRAQQTFVVDRAPVG